MTARKPTAPRKGQQTRAAIVEAALEHAARAGLEGITIGALAERMQMSKSGVFAHFGSREELQIAVLKAYEVRFIETILKPALAEPRGLPRLVAILNRWLDRTAIEAAMGCIWVSGASEYDDRPGAVRDELVAKIEGWQREVGRAIGQAIQAGHLRQDTDIDDLVFGIYGVILVLHHDARLMRSPDALPRARRALVRLLRQYASPGVAAAEAALGAIAVTSAARQRPAGDDRPASTQDTADAAASAPLQRHHPV
jgi:AcrR family transcriptional regulator